MKYFAIDLVNYDENNIPYPVETVHCAANKVLSREEATEFCREECLRERLKESKEYGK